MPPTPVLLAFLHLLGFGLAPASILARAWFLARAQGDPVARHSALLADNVWGIASLLLIPVGLLRAFAGVEKGTDYYLSNHLFWAKMALIVVLVALETGPMIALIRWRVLEAKGLPVDDRRAPLYAKLSAVEAVLTVGVLACAVGMARGYGVGA